jgi:hypothetical protein
MSKPHAVVESLEGRSLLSASMPMLSYAHAWPTTTTTSAAAAGAESAAHHKGGAVAAAAAKAKKKAKAKPFSVVGEWDGRYEIKAFPFKLKYDLDVQFDTVGKSTAQGTVTIDDHDYDGRWTGYTNKQKGYFSYTLKKHGDSVTITGTLNANSTYAWGTIKVDWGWRYSKGDFSMTKIG